MIPLRRISQKFRVGNLALKVQKELIIKHLQQWIIACVIYCYCKNKYQIQNDY